MIVKAESKHYEEITSFCNGHILGSRIMCLMNCYGFDFDFFNIYFSCSDSVIKAVISDFDGNVTIISQTDCDFNEISDFLGFINYNSITTQESIAALLGLNGCELKTAYRYCGTATDSCVSENADETDYSSVYGLISRSIPDSFAENKEAYLSWLSDFTYRKRRNSARIKCIKEDGRVLGCALTSAECVSSAIISGVACDSSKRRSGIGKAVVLSLANELKKENKDVYVIALNASAEGFYEHISFEKHCVIAISER